MRDRGDWNALGAVALLAAVTTIARRGSAARSPYTYTLTYEKHDADGERIEHGFMVYGWEQELPQLHGPALRRWLRANPVEMELDPLDRYEILDLLGLDEDVQVTIPEWLPYALNFIRKAQDEGITEDTGGDWWTSAEWSTNYSTGESTNLSIHLHDRRVASIAGWKVMPWPPEAVALIRDMLSAFGERGHRVAVTAALRPTPRLAGIPLDQRQQELLARSVGLPPARLLELRRQD